MTQTTEGARIAVAKILARDPDHYRKIGRAGGKKSRGGGFTKGSEHTRIAGRKGGTVTWSRHSETIRKKFIESRKSFKR